MGSLTAAGIRAITEPGKYPDGDSLYLTVSPGGTKSWTMRLTVDGKRTERGLGSFQKLSVANARKMRDDTRHAVRQGHNPRKRDRTHQTVKVAQPGPVPTFREAAAAWDALTAAKRKVSGAKIMRTLELHAFPAIGDASVADITRPEIAAILNPLRRNNPPTERKLHGAINDIFRWVVAGGHRVDNPADSNTGPLLATVEIQETHHAALHHSEVADALHKIIYGRGDLVSQLALQFVIFTGARQGEVRGATWGEIDGDVWRIPASRMKARRDHTVPLSIQAQTVLQQARGLHPEWPEHPQPDDVIFVNPSNGKALGPNSLVKRCHQDSLNCTPHGFRSTLTGWAMETGDYSRELMKIALAHTIGDRTTQAYFRNDLLEQRREMLQRYADYIDPLPF